MLTSLVIIGAGAHGRIVAEAAAQTGRFDILGFADDNPALVGTKIGSRLVLGSWAAIAADSYIIAMGNNAVRYSVSEKLQTAGKPVATIISPRAYVSEEAMVGPGSVVLAGAVIQAGARIGGNVIVNAGAVIDHDAVIGDFAHVGANATVSCFGIVASQEFLLHGSVRSRTSPA